MHCNIIPCQRFIVININQSIMLTLPVLESVCIFVLREQQLCSRHSPCNLCTKIYVAMPMLLPDRLWGYNNNNKNFIPVSYPKVTVYSKMGGWVLGNKKTHTTCSWTWLKIVTTVILEILESNNSMKFNLGRDDSLISIVHLINNVQVFYFEKPFSLRNFFSSEVFWNYGMFLDSNSLLLLFLVAYSP